MIIFNEKTHAEIMINKGFITPNQEIRDLFILAKYLYYIGLSEDEVAKRLDDFMNTYRSEYNENMKNGIIRKTTISAKMGKLVFDKKIQIYENEINIIKSLNDINLKKLLFTYLVLSKFFNGLFKISRAELFRLAKIEIHNRDKPKLIYELNKTGYTITTSKKGKTLRGVNIIPQGDAIQEFIVDEDFVLQYLLYQGYYKKCEVCGSLIEINNIKNTSQKYCNQCKIEVLRKQWRDSKQRANSNKQNSHKTLV